MKGERIAMSTDTEMLKRLSEINAETTRLEKNLTNIVAQNKLIEKSMQYSADPFLELSQKSDNLKRAIADTTEQLNLLQEKESIVESQFKNGDISQSQYDEVKNQTLAAKNQLNDFSRELNKTNEYIKNFKVEELSSKFENVGSSLTNTGKEFTKFSAMATNVLSIGNKLTQSAIKQGLAINELAQRYQMSATSVQKWQFIAKQCGVEAEVLTKAYDKARSAMLNFDSGKINAQSQAVATLGINIKNFANSESAFEGIIFALANLKDGTQQATLANEIFGDKIASDLLPVLNSGSDNLKQYADQFDSLNPLTDKQVSKLVALNQQMQQNKETLNDMTLQIGAALAPVLQTLLDFVENKVLPKFKELSERFANLSDNSKIMAVGVLGFAAALAPLLKFGGKVISGIGTMISIIPKLNGLLSSLSTHPIIAIIGIIAILLGTLYMTNEQFRESINSMMEMLSELAMPIMDIMQTCLSVIFGLVGGLINALGGPLAQVIDMLCVLLQPLIDMMTWVINAASKVIDIGAIIFGKGWLWGKDDKKKSKTVLSAPKYESKSYDFSNLRDSIDVPNFSTTATKYSNSNSVDTFNVKNDIVINAADMNERDLEKAISQAFNKQMLSKYLAFR